MTPSFFKPLQSIGENLFVSSAAFSPSSINGLKLWLKADSLSLSDGASVTSWPDSSGNSHNCAPGSGCVAPLYKTNIKNGKPALLFNGNDTSLDIAGMGDVVNGDNTYSWFIVIYPIAFGVSPIILVYPTTGSWTWLLEYEANGNFYWGSVTGSYRLYTTGWSLNTWALIEALKSADVNGKFYSRGTEKISYTNGGAGMVATVSMSGAIRLGAYPGNAYAFAGYIAEVLYYDSTLSDVDRIAVETYLIGKYSL